MKKNLYQTVLMAALGLAGAATAQAQIANNDLVLGFTSQYAGVSDDYLVDLGQLPANTSGNYNSSLNVSGFNSSTFGTIFNTALANGAVNVGIIGGKFGSSGDVIFSEVDTDNLLGSPQFPGSSTPGQDTQSSLQNGAEIPDSLTLGSVAQSATTSFYYDVAENPSTAGAAGISSFTGYVDNPLGTLNGSDGILLDLYQDSYNLGGPGSWSYVGDVELSVSGDNLTATFDPTPEPGTAMIAGLSGLSLLFLRRRFNKNA